jgi:fructose-1,6-bisphosphatase/inositol monophosphatase family enzyme
VTYIIDPIDGTKEWLARGFYCSTSVGIEENNQLVGGVVYDFMRDITYAGYKGELWILHAGKRHEMRDRPPMPRLRLAVNKFPELVVRLPQDRFTVLEKGGSIALGLAEVAAGTLDGIISADIGKGNVWDVAGGAYLLEAKGMLLWDIHGQPFDYKKADKGIVALRPEIADEVLQHKAFRLPALEPVLR